MNDPVPSILFRTRFGRAFLLLWTGGILLVAARVAFDVRTVLYGSTIVCRSRHHDVLMHVPPGVHDAEYRYPLLIYLHGAGERNRSVRSLGRADIVRFAGPVARTDDFPFLVICPKTIGPRWESKRLIALLDEFLSDENLRWKIDPERIYLTGFSMGGFGTFSIAAEHPARFAAVVPVAGGGEPRNADQYARLPVWAFHGEADEIVPREHSSDMLEALWRHYPEMKEMHRLTVYPDANHDIARRVYGNPELYRWLLRHRNRGRLAPLPVLRTSTKR